MTGRNPMPFLGEARSSTAFLLLLLALTGCSLDVGGTEFHVGRPDVFAVPPAEATMPFTATGQPVDDEVVCARGSVTIGRLETADGAVITSEGWAAMYDAAMAEGSIAEAYLFEDFECADGSGSFSMKVHARFDFATFDLEGEHDVGRWEIETGTGEYSSLSGSGDVTIDWDGDDVKLDGDVR